MRNAGNRLNARTIDGNPVSVSPVINVKRLNKIADYIAGLNPKKFNMDQYGEDGPVCGFVGCGIGHAAHDRIFKGLTLAVEEGCQFAFACRPGNTTYTVGYNVDGKTYFSWYALQKLFDISEAETDYLFGCEWFEYDPNGRQATPKRVAARIRKFIEERDDGSWIADTPIRNARKGIGFP